MVKDAEELGAQCSSDELDGLSLNDKLYELDTAINSFLTGEMTGLTQALDDRFSQLQDAESYLENAQSAMQQIRQQTNAQDGLKSDLQSTLEGSTFEELEKQLQALEVDFESTQLKLDVVRSSLKYLEAVANGTSQDVCPTCQGSIQPVEVRGKLEGLVSTGDHKTTKILEKRDRLRERISVARQLTKQIDALDSDIAQHKSVLAVLLNEAAQKFSLSSPLSIESLCNHAKEVRKGHEDLRKALGSQKEALKTWESRIENARQEIRFHQLRALKDRLQRLYDVRYQALHDSLKDLMDLRDIADETRSLLNSKLRARLEHDLPPVEQQMTDVYLRLTGSPTFDSIGIRQGENEDGLMTLDLSVSSSLGPGSWGVGQGILNGQALNAIHLVPYFVFSRYQVDPLLDLLLLDDPTQAFDTNNINLLLTELADAASHATLFIATHEEERFLPVLKNHFSPSDLRAYKAVGTDKDGPQFEDVSIPL